MKLITYAVHWKNFEERGKWEPTNCNFKVDKDETVSASYCMMYIRKCVLENRVYPGEFKVIKYDGQLTKDSIIFQGFIDG